MSPLIEPLPSKSEKSKTKAKNTKKSKIVPVGLIPIDCKLNVGPPRISSICNELSTLDVDQYPNACSVTLRVFLELSVDHYLQINQAMDEENRFKNPLAKRLKFVVEHLHAKKLITLQYKTAMDKIADSRFIFAASIPTFNLYVHNPHIFPKSSELRQAWSEIQPFLEKIWP